jgi:hydrogenase maturation factor HypF (carbamoyltransferase family)
VRRVAVTARGTMQGVGFRPFVYAAATSRGLAGWVEAVRDRLSTRGFRVFTPRMYPPNDGGLSLGQLFVAACRKESSHVPRHTG